MICLNENDIMNAVSLGDVLEAVESALVLYEKQEFHMPVRMHADYQGNTLLLMPCFTPRRFGTKLVSLFPGNPGKGLPVLKGTMILNDGETGEPLAMLNAAVLTALRTGAVGGMGIRHLVPGDVSTLGVIGAGVQGYHQALFATQVRDFSRILVLDADISRARAMIEKLSRRCPGIEIRAVEEVRELVSESQVIITATNAREPVIPDDEQLVKGKHFIGIGSYKPDMREFPGALFRLLERVYVDTLHAVEETGDLITPLERGWIKREQVSTLGKRITRIETGQYDTTLFKSVGMALFDLITADVIYQSAQSKQLGTKVEL